MNKHILFVMRSLDNPELFTQEEKTGNSQAAFAADTACAIYDNATAAAWYAAVGVNAELWVNAFFRRTSEDRQEYIDEVEMLKKTKAPWHTLAGETPAKGERLEMTQDNFYRVIAMNDELIHQQKAEIAKLKQTVNKLQMKGE